MFLVVSKTLCPLFSSVGCLDKLRWISGFRVHYIYNIYIVNTLFQPYGKINKPILSMDRSAVCHNMSNWHQIKYSSQFLIFLQTTVRCSCEHYTGFASCNYPVLSLETNEQTSMNVTVNLLSKRDHSVICSLHCAQSPLLLLRLFCSCACIEYMCITQHSCV